VLVSHVDFDPGEDDGILVPQHQRICDVLRRRGVPEADIVVVGSRHRVARDEAVSLAAWLPAEHPARVMVVTNDYHTRRARMSYFPFFHLPFSHLFRRTGLIPPEVVPESVVHAKKRGTGLAMQRLRN
jgi:hypothetical protein